MAKTLLKDPLFPIKTVDTDIPLTEAKLNGLLKEPGITLLIRSSEGDPRRGGYYFQIEVNGEQYILHPFVKAKDGTPTDVYNLSFDELLKLVNHMSGRAFDEDSLTFVREVIDMPSD